MAPGTGKGGAVEPEPRHVTDFAGAVDGSGFKTVMTTPKTPIELIPPQFLEGIAAVLQFGAKKYARNNWMKGMSWSVVFGSIMRHLWAWFRGEENDPESGLPHLWHAGCGLMFLSFFAYKLDQNPYKQFDDRVFTILNKENGT